MMAKDARASRDDANEDRYLTSFDMIEELLMLADTKESRQSLRMCG